MFSIVRRIGGALLAANFAAFIVYAIARGLMEAEPTVGQEVAKTAEFYAQTSLLEVWIGLVSLALIAGAIVYGILLLVWKGQPQRIIAVLLMALELYLIWLTAQISYTGSGTVSGRTTLYQYWSWSVFAGPFVLGLVDLVLPPWPSLVWNRFQQGTAKVVQGD